MASTIKLKNGSGAPTAGDLVQGEPALDLTNKRLYTEDAGGTVVEVGTNPTDLTIGGTALTATATELNYTDGVTSNIQTQLNTKPPIASPTFTGTATIPTADINGGTIDGTVIGGTTAAAGSFTTMAASGAVTLSGGTANGVAFLNGSKVLTTGSALTFNGTTLIAPAGGLQIGSFAYFNGGVTSNVVAGTNAAFGLEIRTNGTERMRIDSSGNVLVGTTTAGALLTVNGSVIGGGQRFEEISKSVGVGSTVDFDISCSTRGFVRVKIVVGYSGNNSYQMHAQYDYITINNGTTGGTATRTDILQEELGNAQFNYSDITVSRPSAGVIRITYAPTSGIGTHAPRLYIDGVFSSVS